MPGKRHEPGACPGYVIDHVRPLACGGLDAPDNMQLAEQDVSAKQRCPRTGMRWPLRPQPAPNRFRAASMISNRPRRSHSATTRPRFSSKVHRP